VKLKEVKILDLVTYGPNKLFDITDQCIEVSEKIREGFLTIFSKGSTGAIVVLPSGKEIKESYERSLWDLVPVYGWQHPGNAYAHLRSTLIGTSHIIPIVKNQLLIPGQSIYFLENQPVTKRHRKIIIQAIEPT